MNHIENPMTNMKHHEPAHDTASKLHEPEGPTFLFQQTCSRRSTGSASAAIAAVRQVAISTPVLRDHLKGNPAYRKSRREQDQKQREGRRKGLHVTTSYRKEKRNIPRMEEGKEQREGDFHLSSTRLTVLRCLHRVTGWAGRGEARERTGRLLLPLATARTLNSGI